MSVLAWDVGTCNLACGVVDYTLNAVDVRSLNITGIVKPKCLGHNKKGIACNNNAKVSSRVLGKDYHYCMVHKKQCEAVWAANSIDSLFTDTDGICEHINTKGSACKTKAKKAYKTRLCNTHYKQLVNKMTKERMFKKIKVMKADDVPFGTLVDNLIDTLEKLLPHFVSLDVKHVRIENQPSYINPTSKSIAVALYTFFAMSAKQGKIELLTLDYISPGSKIKLLEKHGIDASKQIEEADEKKKYDVTKNLVETYIRKRLASNANCTLDISIFPKFDDPADALAFAFYVQEKIVA